MIDLNAVMEELEDGGKKSVRLYHAKGLKMWVAQTFPDDSCSGKALNYGTAPTPEEALERLKLDQSKALNEALDRLLKVVRRV